MRSPNARTMTRVVPPAASLAIHGTLLGAILVVSRVASTEGPPPDEVLAEIDLNAFASETAAPRTPPTLDPIAIPPADTPATTGSTSTAEPAEAVPVDALAGVTSRAIGAGDSNGAPARGPSLGATSAVARGGTTSPSASFAGLSARAAADVVYVVDASGAVVSTFSYLRARLARSIERLSPTQRVQVVLFRERAGEPDALVFGAGELVRATPSTKRALLDWVDGVNPAGRSNPAAGLTRAFELNPDLVFFLSTAIERTNGEWGAGRDAILTRLDVLNPPSERTGRRPTVIKTIQFMRDDPSGLMRDIAQRHGDGASSYRLLTLEDLDRADDDTLTPLADVIAPDLSPADALGEVERDGSALALLAGIPTEAQRTRLRDAAARALRDADPTADDPASMTLRARAAVLLLASDPEDRDAARVLRELLPVLDDAALLDPDADAARRLTLAAGFALLGDPAQASVRLTELLADTQQIETAPELIGEARLLRLAVEPDAGRRRLFLSDLDTARARPPFRETGDDINAWAQLADAAVVRARLRSTRASPKDLVPLATADDATLNAAADRLAPDADAPMAWLDAPPALALRRAAWWARDPRTRPASFELLGVLAEGELGGDALWELAVAHRLAGDDDAAAGVLARLAGEHADHPRALDALASVADALASAAPERDEEIDLLVFALRRLPDHPRTSAWRVALAERVPGVSRLEILEPIGPDDPVAPRATPMVLEALDLLEPGSADDARVSPLGAYRQGEALARAHAPDAWPRVALRLAGLELDLGKPVRAIVVLQRLAERAPAVARTPSVRLLRAEAEISAGDEAMAAERLTALTAELEPAPGERPDPAFWHAWTLLLELAGPGDPKSATHVARLRLIDTALGGEPWRARLEALARRAAEPVHSTS